MTVSIMIEPAIDAVASTIQSSFNPVAFLVEMTLDPIALALEPFGQFVLAICSGLCRSGVEPIVDPIASGIEMLIDTRSSRIQPLVDPIAAPVIRAIISPSRYRAAKD
ncbi:MAG TPA: hypothetical protein VFP18_09950 [Candidatus Binatia bacterium]|nr:hypothetical protein [Candidatus Binatia bacterium]